MKKSISLLTLILFTGLLYSQNPARMSYQAVVRNTSNELISSAPIGIRISILQGSASGNTVYSETHTTNTNIHGLLSLEIGGGSVIQGTFSSLDWNAGPYFIKTETDPQGGSNYTISGTSQLLSVPYSIHSKHAGTSGVDGLISDGTFTGTTPYWNGSEWITSASNFFNNGTNIGIGTNNPQSLLHVNGNTTISGTSTANNFVKPGGTSSEFLKADGSVDNNTYLISGQEGVTQVAPISAFPNANGATISGNTLTLQPASALYGGIMSTGAQTFSGEKYFNTGLRSEGVLIVGNEYTGNGRVRILSNNNVYSDPIGTQLYIKSGNKSWSGTPGDTIPLFSAADIDASNLGDGDPVTFVDATALHLTAPQGTGFINPLALKANGSVKINGSILASEAATIGDITYTNADGLTGQVLTTDGNGNTSWQTVLNGLGASDLLQSSNDLSDVHDAAAARTNLGLGTASSPSFSGITITGGTPAAGSILTSDASGNASWQNHSLKTLDHNPFVMLDVSYSGKLITTQWGGQPSFPENLPDGFTCEIINYSNAPYTSNTLNDAFFFHKNNGWNNGNGSSSLTIPSGGTVRINVITVNGVKGYFVSGDIN